MLRAILFDLDGTLANTDPIHFKIWRVLLGELNMLNITIDRDFYDAHVSGRLNVDIIQDLLPQLSPEEGKALSDRKEALFRQEARTQMQRLSGLSSFLAWIEERQMKRAVVTNAPPKNAWFSLDVLQLRDFFEVVVISEELPYGKPHPLPYEVGLQKLNVAASQAIAFEDSPSGIQSAVGAGLLTVGVASTHDPKELLQAGSKTVITDFQDPKLPSLLNTF